MYRCQSNLSSGCLLCWQCHIFLLKNPAWVYNQNRACHSILKVVHNMNFPLSTAVIIICNNLLITVNQPNRNVFLVVAAWASVWEEVKLCIMMIVWQIVTCQEKQKGDDICWLWMGHYSVHWQILLYFMILFVSTLTAFSEAAKSGHYAGAFKIHTLLFDFTCA
jgi:hypothetical protein